jgi:OOP family OmpA-OmpF porin
MDDPDLASLRAMLLGPEQRQLEALQARVDDKEGRAEDLAAVLPRVLLQHADDPHFTRALAPPIESAITASVQRNPGPLADALFPVMGPAIRKAVAAGLASMVDSLNRTLEHSLSLRSFKWRLEAMRTGRSFGEVVLLKTLLYRVEQVFLIDRHAGLLLQHVTSGVTSVRDADMVSGMLTAIRDFVQDSFHVPQADSLEALKVGELSVLVEPGPRAVIAAVVRGGAPREYRQTLQDTLETIHLQFADALESFNGDASTLDGARDALEGCLQSQFRAAERTPSTRSGWLLVAVVLLVLATWAGLTYRGQLRTRAYLARLSAEPGVTVVSSERRWGQLIVSGLRDPLARDPAALIEGTGLAAADVSGHWAPYYSLDPPLVLARARAVLHPPEGVTLELKDGMLSASGNMSAAWIAETRRLTPLVPGLVQFDAAGASATSIRRVTDDLSALRVLFQKGSVALAPGQDRAVQRLTDLLQQLDVLARASGQHFAVDVIGRADADGPDEANIPLSRARAAVILEGLTRERFSSITLTSDGVGSRELLAPGDDEASKSENRSVTVRITGTDRRAE